MINIEKDAFDLYRIIGNQALIELSMMEDWWISRDKAMRLRDKYKVKSDKLIMFNNSDLGRLFAIVINKPLTNKFWYEAYDFMLAHMNILGVNSINSLRFSEVVFDEKIYEKYFKDNFEQYVKLESQIGEFSNLTKEQKRDFINQRIAHREMLIPKYGMLSSLEQQDENE